MLQHIFISFFLVYSLSTSANTIKIKVLDSDLSNIENTVVSLTPKNSNSIKQKILSPLVVTQKNKQFNPYIGVIQKGQSVVFKNNDDITHHVYSVSTNNRFDFKIKSETQNRNIQLNSLGEVAMGCNIHDWMSGFVLVVDTPFYTQTNSQSIATFENMLLGEYQLVIWHPQLDTPDNQIVKTINITGNKQWDFTLPRKLLPIPEQANQEEFEFLQGY
ncbi:hypothetical protein [Pseudoalteromonas denitrificans]|uniref:Plastocyanin n=1 Tax=Pseudoalteromonas denitrificans DSM 6059 TaxID=1123010 RepID=A0A1I1FKX3_9GAMM|nr:hypothetical protein [Pseudoalteromonas denitrificans]SFB99636.1 hypothetical protein SAMN02745724_00667 [Pseudoalteromonas denitrificans DSM 6059]